MASGLAPIPVNERALGRTNCSLEEGWAGFRALDYLKSYLKDPCISPNTQTSSLCYQFSDSFTGIGLKCVAVQVMSQMRQSFM